MALLCLVILWIRQDKLFCKVGVGKIKNLILPTPNRMDGPYERAVRTVRTDRPYGPSVRTVRTDRPYGWSVGFWRAGSLVWTGQLGPLASDGPAWPVGPSRRAWPVGEYDENPEQMKNGFTCKCFPMVSRCPWVFTRFPIGFPQVFLWFSQGHPCFFRGVPWFSLGFPKVPPICR